MTEEEMWALRREFRWKQETILAGDDPRAVQYDIWNDVARELLERWGFHYKGSDLLVAVKIVNLNSPKEAEDLWKEHFRPIT